jgi:capsular polysaccharide biosynthesis protein
LPLSNKSYITLFNGAKFIVSPHGAGLANLVFCKVGAKVLEMLSPLYLNACYRKVAA